MKRLPFFPIAWTLAIFTAVVFTLDNVARAIFPNWWVMQKAWEQILPGFTFGSWAAFFLGLVESFIAGFGTAVLFLPIYNFFAAREEREAAKTTPPAGHDKGART